jgi:hypothetical protein
MEVKFPIEKDVRVFLANIGEMRYAAYMLNEYGHFVKS